MLRLQADARDEERRRQQSAKAAAKKPADKSKPAGDPEREPDPEDEEADPEREPDPEDEEPDIEQEPDLEDEEPDIEREPDIEQEPDLEEESEQLVQQSVQRSAQLAHRFVQRGEQLAHRSVQLAHQSEQPAHRSEQLAHQSEQPAQPKKRGRPKGSKAPPKQSNVEVIASIARMALSETRAPPTARDIIRWIETKCFVPEGKLIGKPFRLDEWQKIELRRIYDNPAGTRRAILSFGRKNGKSSLAAVLLLVHLCGPMARPNGQLFSAAQSREQAALIFNLAAKIVRMSPALRDSVNVKDSTKELDCFGLGTHYRALSAEASTAFGLSPVFIVHDELGQVRGPRSKLYEALETATGAQDNPLSVIISTQAPADTDLLSILIEDALGSHDPRVVCKLYTAPMTADPFDDETIKLANPAWNTFLNPVEVRAMADDAKRMPSKESEYRNLILNQRVEALAQFIAPAVWAKCGSPVGDLTQCREVYGGLDLSEANDLTALVLIGKIDGIWHARAWFWLPHENLADRARNDHVPYDQWHKDGLIETVEGSAIGYDKVAPRVIQILEQHKVRKIAFDRWNFKHFRPWLVAGGVPEHVIVKQWEEFGQGTASMSPALRELEGLILNRALAHGNNPVLNMCAANAVVIEGREGARDVGKDSANRRLSKKRSTGRIDGLVSLAMAVGVAPLAKAKVDIAALIG
jgi:phage terminase large subunit-like protein